MSSRGRGGGNGGGQRSRRGGYGGGKRGANGQRTTLASFLPEEIRSAPSRSSGNPGGGGHAPHHHDQALPQQHHAHHGMQPGAQQQQQQQQPQQAGATRFNPPPRTVSAPPDLNEAERVSPMGMLGASSKPFVPAKSDVLYGGGAQMQQHAGYYMAPKMGQRVHHGMVAGGGKGGAGGVVYDQQAVGGMHVGAAGHMQQQYPQQPGMMVPQLANFPVPQSVTSRMSPAQITLLTQQLQMAAAQMRVYPSQLPPAVMQQIIQSVVAYQPAVVAPGHHMHRQMGQQPPAQGAQPVHAVHGQHVHAAMHGRQPQPHGMQMGGGVPQGVRGRGQPDNSRIMFQGKPPLGVEVPGTTPGAALLGAVSSNAMSEALDIVLPKKSFALKIIDPSTGSEVTKSPELKRRKPAPPPVAEVPEAKAEEKKKKEEEKKPDAKPEAESEVKQTTPAAAAAAAGPKPVAATPAAASTPLAAPAKAVAAAPAKAATPAPAVVKPSPTPAPAAESTPPPVAKTPEPVVRKSSVGSVEAEMKTPERKPVVAGAKATTSLPNMPVLGPQSAGQFASAMSPVPAHSASAVSSSSDGDDAAKQRGSGKRTYERDFLLKFQTLCTDVPADMVMLPITGSGGVGSGGGNNSGNNRGGFGGSGGHHGNNNNNNYNNNSGNYRGGGGMMGGGVPRPGSAGKHGQYQNMYNNNRNNSGNRRGRNGGNMMMQGGHMGGKMHYGGVGGGVGGRGNRGGAMVPLQHVKPLTSSANAWKRPDARKIDKTGEVYLKARGLLNKLTLERFEAISNKLMNVGITTAEVLRMIITLVFDKALREPNFAAMYAELCLRLSRFAPEIEGNSFKRLLLNRCQEEFERPLVVDAEEAKGLSKEELDLRESKLKQRMLGNIKFIGELFKKRMLTERIMHQCIQRLLGDINNPVPDDVEALCKLMTTIGAIIDHPKAAGHMEQYFARIKGLSKAKGKLDSRIRFMLLDVIELRATKWVAKRVSQKDKGPMKIEEVHRQAAQKEADTHRANRGALRRSQQVLSKKMRGSPLTSGGSNSGGGGGGSGSGWEVQRSRNSSSNKRGNRTPPIANAPSKRGERIRKGSLPLSKGDAQGSAPQHNPSSLPESRSSTSPNQPRATAANGGASDTSLTSPVSTPPVNEYVVKKNEAAGRPPVKPVTDRQIEMIVQELYQSCEIEEAVECFKELEGAPNYATFRSKIISLSILDSLERRDKDRALVVDLLQELTPAVLDGDDYVDAFEAVFEVLPELVVDVPRAPDYLATYLAAPIEADIVPFGKIFPDLVKPLVESGVAGKVFAKVMHHLLEDVDNVANLVKFDLRSLLPPHQQTKTGFETFVSRSNLGFLYPLLGVEAQVAEIVAKNPGKPLPVIEWLEENVKAAVRESKDFYQMLMRIMVQDQQQQQQQQLGEWQCHVLSHFVEEDDLTAQVQLLAALQLMVADDKKFPADFYFQSLFDQGVCCTEAYRGWSDDEQNERGKQDTLFKVNRVINGIEELTRQQEEEEAAAAADAAASADEAQASNQ